MVRILIVDDEPATRKVMARALGAKYECLTAADAEQALKVFGENPDIALVLTDYRMPGMNGVELLAAIKAEHPQVHGILITAFGEIELAVEAMKQGADDFLTKPITELSQLEIRVSKALEKRALEQRVADLESRLEPKSGLDAFTGSSPAMERVYTLIRKIAPTNASVLIEGESGTGKELVAQALHDLSPRKAKPFIAVECAALSKELIESELFGYEPGSFTGGLKDGKTGRFEAANGGTLFLDEIGEIDIPTQIKLLRVLETRRVQRVGSTREIAVDFRLVAATNRDLAAMVREGTFREDLYYRLNVIGIKTPALREHPDDIPLLVARFVREFSAANGNSVTGIEPDALHALESFAWPGNIRQLRNVIERMVVLAGGARLTVEDLPLEIRNHGAGGANAGAGAGEETPPVLGTLATAEREQILSAIKAADGNKSKAAEALGISRRTIHRKLKEWGIAK